MDQKEKITALIDMGFSVDEAIALATGNYRTVPDQNTPDQNTPDQNTPDQNTPEQNAPEQNAPEEKNNITLGQMFSSLQLSIDNLQKALIKQNINDDTQPQQLSATDILGKMLEPVKPEERS